jgi:hypothetical protein
VTTSLDRLNEIEDVVRPDFEADPLNQGVASFLVETSMIRTVEPVGVEALYGKASGFGQQLTAKNIFA